MSTNPKPIKYLPEIMNRFQSELRVILSKKSKSEKVLADALAKYHAAEDGILPPNIITTEKFNAFLDGITQLHAAVIFRAKWWSEYESTLAVYKQGASDAIEKDKNL